MSETKNLMNAEKNTSTTPTKEENVIDLNAELKKDKSEKNNAEQKVNLPKIKSSEVPVINYDDFKPIFKFEGLTDEQLCDGAMNRLTQDTYFGINGLPLIACWLYVYNKARSDVDFAKKVCIKSKCFTKAFDYLTKELRTLSEGNSGVGVDHRQIFAILEDYYDLDDKVIAEKEVARKAKEAEERKKREAESKAKKKASKKSEKTKVGSKKSKTETEKKAKVDAEQAQENLFDLLGGSF